MDDANLWSAHDVSTTCQEYTSTAVGLVSSILCQSFKHYGRMHYDALQELTRQMQSSFVFGAACVPQAMAFPIVATLARPEKMGQALGYLSGAFLVGNLAGRVLSGIIAQYFGWRVRGESC